MLDGPSAAITSLGGLAVARDGNGGVVYLKQVGGVPHVFVSRLLGGIFQTPVQVDTQLPGASSQPVIAASNGALLVVAFINGGSLYEITAAGALASLSAPADVYNGAANPAIASTNVGKYYLAFTAAGAGGHDVRCAYYYSGQWSLEPTPLDALAGDDAGTGTGRPAVAAAGDGVGIVAWGEGGHVYVRRVWADAPSAAVQQADVPSISGWGEVSADQPALGSGAGDSSYVAVAFREKVTNGADVQARVLMRRLQATEWVALAPADGLTTPGVEGANDPQVTVGEYGDGFVFSQRTVSDQLIGMRLSGNAVPGSASRIDVLQNAGAPLPAASFLGYRSVLVAYAQDPGAAGSADLRARLFDGSAWEPEQILSVPAEGAVNAAAGLDVAGDIAADGAVAWVQSTNSGNAIVTDQMYQPPGAVNVASTFAYARTPSAVLTWSSAKQTWGPLLYTVTLDGVQVAQTSSTSVAVPNDVYPLPLTQGQHLWRVSVANPAGLTKTSALSTIFVDTVAPSVRLSLTGTYRVGSTLHLVVHATDAPPPLTRSQASGIALTEINFGDGTTVTGRRSKFHTFKRARRYRVTVTVTDKAGNRTTATQRIRIRGKVKPKKKKKGGHHG